ncbi:hypothetical protein LLEC1_01598 [Akanthomyces lecanii]|uniref:EKC/KEOPS complex subunit BUD32 n=1 Tax=Cordyceps confragosa TaxID=2714763 RepID=A0A179I522_CORDF|nr:hypothetical protein LLEC1_01598 [Akanthomyces lecanii]
MTRAQRPSSYHYAELSPVAWPQLHAADGLVHDDLRPANMLLDEHDHLHAHRVRQRRSLKLRAPARRGRRCTFAELVARAAPAPGGRYDAASEQFAYGSMLYGLVTGAELYEGLGPKAARDCEFPPLGETPLERLTVRCWMGGFASLADLGREAATLEGAEAAKDGTRFEDEYVVQAKRRCQRFLEEELTDIVPHADAVKVEDDSS